MRGDREIGPRRHGLARPGQRAMKRLDFEHFVHAVPGLGAELASLPSMPGSRVNLDPDGAAEVSCDCGALPHRLAPALSALCECRRLYVHIGRGDVRGLRLAEEDGDDG